MFNKTALPCEYLDRKLPAVLASHDSFDVFEEDRTDAAVIVKLLAAIVNPDDLVRALAQAKKPGRIAVSKDKFNLTMSKR